MLIIALIALIIALSVSLIEGAKARREILKWENLPIFLRPQAD